MHVRHVFIPLLCFCVSAGFTVNAVADTATRTNQLPTSSPRPNANLSANALSPAKTRADLLERYATNLQTWMAQVYLSNTHELQKSTQVSPREMAEWVFHGPFNWKFDAIRSLQGSEALQLSVSDDFLGDRILAFTTGTYTLLSPYFQSAPLDYSTNHKPMTVAIEEIKRTLDTLMQTPRHSAANITILATEYDALLMLLSNVESDIHTAAT